MRINKFVAQALGIGRRKADQLIATGQISVNGRQPEPGQQILDQDSVLYQGKELEVPNEYITIALHKPVGYVCSRDGQGSSTIYDLLPRELQILNPAGRLDKDSSGILVLSSDGNLLERLTHPKYEKQKIYEVQLHKALTNQDFQRLKQGVQLQDGLSTFDQITLVANKTYRIVMHEGRNRQIRRTFDALGYRVVKLHRTHFGPHELNGLPAGKHHRIML